MWHNLPVLKEFTQGILAMYKITFELSETWKQ